MPFKRGFMCKSHATPPPVPKELEPGVYHNGRQWSARIDDGLGTMLELGIYDTEQEAEEVYARAVAADKKTEEFSNIMMPERNWTVKNPATWAMLAAVIALWTANGLRRQEEEAHNTRLKTSRGKMEDLENVS
jgi:hypothetical protein